MTREGGHVVRGVCSPFESGWVVDTEFYVAFKSFMGR
jgi:hypothetical protein